MTVVYDRDTLMRFVPSDLNVQLDAKDTEIVGGADARNWQAARRLTKQRYKRSFMLSILKSPASQGNPPESLPRELSKLLARGGGNGGNSQRRSSSGPGGNAGSGNRPIRIVLPSKEKVKLHTSENAWKPGDKTQTDPDAPMVKLATGILNKITEETFPSLSKKLLACGITSEARMGKMLDLIFTKAQDQAFFNHLYAQICARMANLSVEGTNFKKLLLQKCAVEFTNVTVAGSKQQEAELTKGMDEGDIELFRAKKKRHLMGYMKFIGELWKVNVIRPKVVGTCIVKLLELAEADEEYLECCCNLLQTIGPMMDSKNQKLTNEQKNIVNSWYRTLETKKLLSNVSTRIAMTIENLIDQRLNKWKGHSKSGELKVIDVAAGERGEQPQPTSTTANDKLDVVDEQSEKFDVKLDKTPPKIKYTADGTIKEYLSVQNVEEVMECIKTFGSKDVDEFLDLLFSKITDATPNSKGAQLLLDLASEIGRRKAVKPHVVEEALARIFEFLDDIKMDNPKADLLLASAVGTGFMYGACSLSVFSCAEFKMLRTPVEFILNTAKAAVTTDSSKKDTICTISTFNAELDRVSLKIFNDDAENLSALKDALSSILPQS